MNFADYRAAPGVNWSTLKYMRDSPAAYIDAATNPRADTTAFLLGRAVHALVLQPDQFDEQFVTWFDGDRRGKAWMKFAEANKSRGILRPVERDLVDAMAWAVIKNDDARDLLTMTRREVSMLWTDPATGLKCKARADALSMHSGYVIDLKTTRSVDARRFGNECARLAYPQQLAHYAAGCEYSAGFVPKRHLIIAVEKMPPHDVGVFEVADVDKQRSAEEVAELLRKVKQCRESGEWPGRYSGVQFLQLPAYVEGELEIEEL